jgi:hypothetical protein
MLVVVTWTSLVLEITLFHGVDAIVMIQVKDAFYHDQYPMTCFSLSSHGSLWVFASTGWFFFHQCANIAWKVKDTKSPPLLTLHSFYKQNMLMALQHAHVTFISRCVIIVGEGFFRLGVLSSIPPPLHLIWHTSHNEGVEYLICFRSFNNLPFFFKRTLHLLGLGPFHLVPFSSPLLGALFYLWLASFHK